MAAKQHTSRTRQSRERRAFTPELIADIALKRFSGLKDGAPTPISKLANEYGRDRTVISRAIVRAFREGLVEVRKVDGPIQLPKTDEDLSRRLLTRYPKLHDAVVIENPWRGEADKVLHRNLGIRMAQLTATRSIVQNGDVVGMGSGRGVEMTLDALQHFPPLRAQNVTIMSLTGSVYSTPKAIAKGLWLDADRHVIEFARHFVPENEPTQYLICHPLAYEMADLEKAKERVWLGAQAGDSAISVPKVTHVLLGVGVFLGKHRFHVEAEAEPANQEPFLRPIHKDLVHLNTLCKEAIAGLRKGSVPDYTPAAEMSNFFFYVPPPAGNIANERAIKNCIDTINSKLLNIKKEHLMNTQMLVVAGTRIKAYALRALINEYPVTYLCTDVTAARELLSQGSMRN